MFNKKKETVTVCIHNSLNPGITRAKTHDRVIVKYLKKFGVPSTAHLPDNKKVIRTKTEM